MINGDCGRFSRQKKILLFAPKFASVQVYKARAAAANDYTLLHILHDFELMNFQYTSLPQYNYTIRREHHIHNEWCITRFVLISQ